MTAFDLYSQTLELIHRIFVLTERVDALQSRASAAAPAAAQHGTPAPTSTTRRQPNSPTP